MIFDFDFIRYINVEFTLNLSSFSVNLEHKRNVQNKKRKMKRNEKKTNIIFLQITCIIIVIAPIFTLSIHHKQTSRWKYPKA